MESTVKQRLIEFLKYKNVSHARFEKACGLSNGYVNNIRKSLQPDKLQKIALIYPDLNPGWLMTGEGEMLRAPQPSATSNSGVKIGNVTASVNGCAAADGVTSELQALRKENEALRRERDDAVRERDRLAGANSALTEVIRQLTGKN